MNRCPCGNSLEYTSCCKLIHKNHNLALSAEMLMRARFTAFNIGLVDFLYNTTHPTTRKFVTKKEIRNWVNENEWTRLEISYSSNDIVEFKAYYLDNEKKSRVQHERSKFQELHGKWYYHSGIFIS